MDKKIIVLLASALTLAATSITASAGVVDATHSFSDVVTVNFASGFPQNDYFYNSYTNDNGVNIIGASFFNTSAPAAITISSTNSIEWGYPSVQMKYDGYYGEQTCKVVFRDGPGILLSYKSGVAPICAGIILSPITQTGLHTYSLTITDSEP